MRAVVYTGAGGAEVLAVREVAKPEPGSDDALVAVAYAGLNRADILERKGQYPSPLGPGALPGLEYAGVVSAIGANVKGVKAGDRVYGLVPGAAHAEFLVTQAMTVAPVPARLSLEEAAAVPEAFITAHDALFARGGFALGKTVLVHAAGSSVGLAAIGLIKNGGGTSIGLSRTAEKLERAKALGLQHTLLLEDGWPERVRELTGGRGVDIVLDFIGASVMEGNLAAAAVGGRVVQIGTLGGYKASFTLGVLMSKRLSMIGTQLRSRPLEERIEIAKMFATRLGPLFERGDLRPEIDRVVPLDQIAEAHRVMEANENFGKIVIAVNPSLG